ncbi:MAG TPA: flagellar export chaperone FliS [Longimicrobiaceae bacterium]|nr:flagellar export chaperone FliS [Longimicrobiaceae bacterium]
MSYASSAGKYLETDIMSRPREWLVPLLYEHLLARLQRASVQIEAGDIEGKAESLSKASEIVLELAGSIDHERGGEIARNLSALYAYFASEILTIGRTLDRQRLGQLTAMAGELHEAWVQAAEQVAPRGRPRAAAVATA